MKVAFFKARKSRIFVLPCEDGTNHLYRLGNDGDENFKRVPMIKEKQLLFIKFHGLKHRPLVRMLTLIKNSFYCFQDLRNYIEESILKCVKCKDSVYRCDEEVKAKKKEKKTTKTRLKGASSEGWMKKKKKSIPMRLPSAIE